MKIAIQGHLTRGKEVIQILESLGGINRMNHKCRYDKYFYYISGDDNTIAWTGVRPQHLGVFTLEEFEKEFPFKIGDEVMFPVTRGWLSGKITGIKDFEYEVDTRIGGYRYVEPHKLQLYPMKEERNITLTLDKAKEWYKKGGDLKQVALQAFSEKELNPLPRSWEEYCRKYGYVCLSTRYTNLSSKYDALIKLEQLRDCWRQGWEPNWLEGNIQKYVIQKWRDRILIETTYVTHSFLSFPTYEMAKEFLECFRDLIEQAGDLI